MDKYISKITPNYLHMRLVTSWGGGALFKRGLYFSLALRDWATIQERALIARVRYMLAAVPPPPP